MAKKRVPKTPKPMSADVENYRHDKAKRRMIPTAEQQGFVPDDDTKPIKLRYPRNPDLDPQLVWRGKDRENDSDLYVDAPPVYIQEKIHPRQIIERLRAETKVRQNAAAEQIDLFADFNGRPAELEAHTEFYQHDQNWSNRMILGDALLVMASLAERENLRGKVQCIYMDPPYGIKFNSNWQVSTGSRDVKDGRADQVSREPEVIKAFRDTWKDGIHSYLSYLRDRVTVARDLLSESGSIFVQIGEENVHVVRAILDEVFGAENFTAQISFKTTSSFSAKTLSRDSDYLIWYAKNLDAVKYRTLLHSRHVSDDEAGRYTRLEEADGSRRFMSATERERPDEIEASIRVYRHDNMYSQGRAVQPQPFQFEDCQFDPWAANSHWKPNFPTGLDRLAKANRLALPSRNSIAYVRYHDDFPFVEYSGTWTDTQTGAFTDKKIYVVQTNAKVIERCLLMATDPGDLVLDPTCGSGTTAYIAEQWGRRWITTDTSRVALALARTRLMGARYPYFLLRDSKEGMAKEGELTSRPMAQETFLRDLRQGFVYERAPHVTLRSIANNAEIDEIWERWQRTLEPLREALHSTIGKSWQEWQIPREAEPGWPAAAKDTHAKWWEGRRARQSEIDASIARNADVELLYDRPYEDKRTVRVAGPFTVESLSPHRVIPTHEDPVVLAQITEERGEAPPAPVPISEETDFAKVVFEHLKAAGVQNTKKKERLVFDSLEPWPGRGYVAFEGRFTQGGKTRRAAIAIGPEYGSVGYEFVRAAAREARDAFDVLIVCGFQFAPEVDDSMLNFGRLTVLKARMNQDIRMGDRLKSTGAGNLFVVFGEPDIELKQLDGGMIQVEIKGVDIFDPTTGEVKSSAEGRVWRGSIRLIVEDECRI
jgi:adenine-specific DNA-methyltransferase